MLNVSSPGSTLRFSQHVGFASSSSNSSRGELTTPAHEDRVKEVVRVPLMPLLLFGLRVELLRLMECELVEEAFGFTIMVRLAGGAGNCPLFSST